MGPSRSNHQDDQYCHLRCWKQPGALSQRTRPRIGSRSGSDFAHAEARSNNITRPHSRHRAAARRISHVAELEFLSLTLVARSPATVRYPAIQKTTPTTDIASVPSQL